MFLLLVLIGSLYCLRPLWLARVINLALALRHSIENRSSVLFACVCRHWQFSQKNLECSVCTPVFSNTSSFVMRTHHEMLQIYMYVLSWLYLYNLKYFRNWFFCCWRSQLSSREVHNPQRSEVKQYPFVLIHLCLQIAFNPPAEQQRRLQKNVSNEVPVSLNFKFLTWAYLVVTVNGYKTYTLISFTTFHAIKNDIQFM